MKLQVIIKVIRIVIETEDARKGGIKQQYLFIFLGWGKKKINRERNIIFNLLRRFFINNRKKKRKNMKKDLPSSF